MRLLFTAALCVVLTGCGLAARQQREEQAAAAKATMERGFAECKAKFPEGSKKYVEKNKCDFEAALIIRPLIPYPDLFDKDWANRAVIAEKLQAGRVTVAQANQEAINFHSDIAAEEQRRNLANRSVGAQESVAAAAWAASRPVSCTHIGSTTTCF